ncbi:MAG TPA: bifunctional riboflavin kinase/FAD synthetase [Spirochaetota bacterium]|nr:bifunctional riboflavin kinase/FAD synthetase [Spirochaetota bacterium]HPI89143.1 bifunctional riboflavin kinase/FAD synthetase [Spirochaetota bacterium]HPR48897.1 bifunctional riboflavin kinase/FAD synthetase [Spirochaetota bacterium]
MKIYHNIPDNKNLFRNPVVTIGNFDGVHLGHRKIFSRLKEVAKKKSGDAVVITFSSHPRKVLYPDIPIKVITTSDEKVNAIFNLGIDNIILLHFTREMANMSAKDFYNDILLTRIDTRELVIGYDHAFGKNREGTIDFLAGLCAETGIGLTRVDEEMLDSRPISSTWLRSLIEEGDLPMVERLLGRRYSLSGTVVRGAGRGGSTLGFPTANIDPLDPDKILPADGSYAVVVTLNSGIKKGGMLNIGMNPTFNADKKTIEVNIFDFAEDIYDSVITVDFVARLRPERRFNTTEDLVAQLGQDKIMALKILDDHAQA